MEGMTEDHEGIFVDIMPRNHLCLFLTKWEKRRRRTRGRKNRDGERNKTHAAELLSQEYTTWYMPDKCPPRGGMVTREIDWTLSFKEIIIVTKAFFFQSLLQKFTTTKEQTLTTASSLFQKRPLVVTVKWKLMLHQEIQLKYPRIQTVSLKIARKRKMSEFSCSPGMQKHELFFLLLLTICKGGK